MSDDWGRHWLDIGIVEVAGVEWNLGYPDQSVLDTRPDLCWRCDARAAACDLGLCEPCREVLR